MSDKYQEYCVKGWVQITVSVDCIVYESSLERAKETIHEDIESGDFAGSYNIKCNDCELSATLMESENE